MRRFFITLGLITSIIAVIFSVTFSKIAFIPAVSALLFGLIAFYLSRKKHYPKKSIQLIMLLTLIALSITSYKALFNVVNEINLEEQQLNEKESKEKPSDDLEDTEFPLEI